MFTTGGHNLRSSSLRAVGYIAAFIYWISGFRWIHGGENFWPLPFALPQHLATYVLWFFMGGMVSVVTWGFVPSLLAEWIERKADDGR